MTRKDRNHFVLSTGLEFYAHLGLIGIAQQTEDDAGYGRVHGFELGEGFDGGVDADEWTTEEQVELAEFMIAQWRAFATAARESIEGSPNLSR